MESLGLGKTPTLLGFELGGGYGLSLLGGGVERGCFIGFEIGDAEAAGVHTVCGPQAAWPVRVL